VHVVITGSRGWTDNALIRDVADTLPERSTVIVGGARGADQAFEGAARIRGHTVIVDRADWSQGRGAGFARNVKMLDRLAHLPDDERLVIAFWLGSSRGTRHTIVEAMRRGYPLQMHWRPEPAA
jgi:hypothetical protein